MSKKERKTHKGTGFHLDLLLICFMELGCAFTGGPWLCAATVRCVSHLCALTVMSSRVAPGETPQVFPTKFDIHHQILPIYSIACTHTYLSDAIAEVTALELLSKLADGQT